MAYPLRPERRGYDTAQVCTNGHLINAFAVTRPDHSEKFCSKCGNPSITECPHCKAAIRGYYHTPHVAGLSPRHPPSYCHECGKPYPWTEERLNTARKLADEAAELDAEEKQQLKETLEDLAKDTPRTPVAAQRFERLWKKMKGSAAGAMREVIIQVASETAKRLIFPSGH